MYCLISCNLLSFFFSITLFEQKFNKKVQKK
nr:MAG TPA: hypothetical protein [Caudoviricetes sp.]DAR75666.1 MAG TPA: hypothetical protein [Bacteriophage sp.]